MEQKGKKLFNSIYKIYWSNKYHINQEIMVDQNRNHGSAESWSKKLPASPYEKNKGRHSLNQRMQNVYQRWIFVNKIFCRIPKIKQKIEQKGNFGKE